MKFDDLKALPQWIAWKVLVRNGNDIKMPINPKTGQAAQTNDPTTWASYHHAKLAVSTYNCNGIGFVFSENDNLVGIDLDHCIDENGKLNDFAKQVVNSCNTYTEYSPSGTGIHLFLTGTIEPLKTKKIEVYSQGRYFTVTERSIKNEPLSNVACISDFIDSFRSKTKRMEVVNNSKPSIFQIRDMLRHIPPDTDYNTWIRIVMAVNSEYPDKNGIDVLDDWCGHLCYEGELQTIFNSLNRNDRSEITLGTLYYYAKNYGWQRSTVADLDRVYPPLTDTQKEQVETIVDRLVDERLLDKYQKTLADLGIEIGLPQQSIKRFGIGYKREINEDGVIGQSAIVIPYQRDNKVVNLEFVDNKESTALREDLGLYQFENAGHGIAILVDGTLAGIKAQTELKSVIELGVPYRFYGVPYLEQDIELIETQLQTHEVYYLTNDRDSLLKNGLYRLKNLRYSEIPIQLMLAITYMNSRSMSNYLKNAKKI